MSFTFKKLQLHRRKQYSCNLNLKKQILKTREESETKVDMT